jgi:hypothetical protein
MKCFIISPIGQPGSPAREHADDVYECIIKPALKEAEIDGHRADHVKDIGRITKQMYDAILNSDFCIAILHGFNPNVFYELAVAHSAGTPVILLTEKGTDPPFDLKDERALPYDLSPRAVYRGDNVRTLVEMIEKVRRLEGRREVPFGSNLTPLNATSARLPYSLSNETNASAEYWLQLIGSSRKRLYLAGIGFSGWRGIPGMREVLGKTAASGCDVRVLTLDAQNPAFAIMLNPNVTSVSLENQGAFSAEARSWFKGAFGDASKSEVRALRKGMLFQQIIVSDDQVLVSPYLYSANTGYSPCLKLSESCAAFGSVLHEFEELWKFNSPS